MASACHPNQAGNADLGTCQEQTDRFCPEGGEWIIPVSTDTSVDYENSAFGPTECTTSPVAGAGGARSFTLEEVRTLLLLDPTIESDNAGRGVRNAETN
ncbi:hypothetical protein, partial [Micrococcus endophyticus]